MCIHGNIHRSKDGDRVAAATMAESKVTNRDRGEKKSRKTKIRTVRLFLEAEGHGVECRGRR